MVEIKLYVEGGGDTEFLHRQCREAFRKFLDKAGFSKLPSKIIACGGRQRAFDRFKTACEQNRQNTYMPILLIDSEDPVTASSPWTHLRDRKDDNFQRPSGVEDNQCHLMVVCMEAWFLADKEVLREFYGQGFNINALPANPHIEAISKNDIFKGLASATANCRSKGSYGKGKHSFGILQLIDPIKVRDASPSAKRFFEMIDDFLKSK